MGFEPMTSVIPVQCSTNWAHKPTGSWSMCWVQINHPSDERWTWMFYLDPTHWPVPSWFVSSVGRVLHQYRRGQGFKSHTGLNFFHVLLLTTRFSSVLSCKDLLISNQELVESAIVSYILVSLTFDLGVIL